MDRFSPEGWAKLSVDERIRLCLLMARQLRKISEVGDPSQRDALIDLADRWDLLASQIGKAG